MRILIAEDDLASRKFLYKVLSNYGECDLTVNGIEAVDAFMISIDEGNVYDLVCLDIMMPKLDGIKTLKVIRDIEKRNGIAKSDRSKIIMTTAISDFEVISQTSSIGSEAYIEKPIDTVKLENILKKLGLID